MADETPQYETSEAFGELVDFTLGHAFKSIADGGPLVPFVVFDDCERGRSVRRFVADLEEGSEGRDPEFDLGASVEEAFAFARTLGGRAFRAAVAIDARIGNESGGKDDCIFVDAFEDGMDICLRIARCYEPARHDAKGRVTQRLVPKGKEFVAAEMEPMW